MSDPNQHAEAFLTTVEKLVTGGRGLGRHEGRVAFVPLTAPGDRVRARVTRRKSGFVEAELLEVLAPGPDRRDAPCPHYGVCGGCDLQHLTPAAQRAAKRGIVVDCLRRLGHLRAEELLEDPGAAGPDTGYRHRVRLHTDPIGHYGLLRRGSQEPVAIGACLQLPADFNDRILPWLRTMPPVQQAIVRLDGRGGCLVSLFGQQNRLRVLKKILKELPAGEPPLAGCAGILFNNLPVWGRDYLLVKVAGHAYKVSASSFFQNNLGETEAVVAAARDWLGAAPRRLLADLYCGVGLFGIALADLFARVLMVEADGGAARDAVANVAHAKSLAERCAVTEASAADVTARWASALDAPPAEEAAASAPTRADWAEACVFVDPPRTGLGETVVANLARLAPREILYLSCDPATLARDLAALTQAGYAPRRLRLVDMFPQTAHIETLAHLARA